MQGAESSACDLPPNNHQNAPIEPLLKPIALLVGVQQTPCGSFVPSPPPLTLTAATAAAVIFSKSSLMVSLRDLPWLSAENISSFTQPFSSGLYSPAGLYSTTSPDLLLLSQEYVCDPHTQTFIHSVPSAGTLLHIYCASLPFFFVIKEPSRDFQSYGKLSVNFLPQAGFPALFSLFPWVYSSHKAFVVYGCLLFSSLLS